MNVLSILRHYWKFLRKHILSQIILLAGYGLGSICTIVIIPLIYKRVIDIVSTGPIDAFDQLRILVVFLGFVILIYNIFFRIADYFLIKSQSQIIKELHDYVLEKLENHSYVFFSNAFVGGLVAKTRRFIHAFETLHDQFIFHVWMNGIALISSFSVLLYQSQRLGIAFLVWMILYGLLVRFMIKWQIPKSLVHAQTDTKTNAHYADIITNILTVKMFGTSLRELINFKETTKEQEKKRKASWMQETFWNGMFQGIVIGIFNIAIIWFAIDLWKKGVIPAGTIVLVQVYVLTSFNIVWSISRNVIRISSSLTNADEMVRILDQEPDIKDIKNPQKINIKKGKIHFKNVTFGYENSKPIFENLNLTIKPGEKIALVGHSGAGKTTIVKLLLRFVDIEKGQILIDNQDITKVNQEELRKNIAYVPQESLLFHRTLRENIAYAKSDAFFSEVVDVAERAQAREFIENLPDRYDSLVGERGIKLSGGERQRIAIARAMLKNSPIIILDEATSSLDSLAEEKIQKALKELMKGKTTIAIAHRLSTIRKMDRIIVFDQGNIKETGTHQELIKKKGIYASLWKSQVGGFIAHER